MEKVINLSLTPVKAKIFPMSEAFSKKILRFSICVFIQKSSKDLLHHEGVDPKQGLYEEWCDYLQRIESPTGKLKFSLQRIVDACSIEYQSWEYALRKNRHKRCCMDVNSKENKKK